MYRGVRDPTASVNQGWLIGRGSSSALPLPAHSNVTTRVTAGSARSSSSDSDSRRLTLPPTSRRQLVGRPAWSDSAAPQAAAHGYAPPTPTPQTSGHRRRYRRNLHLSRTHRMLSRANARGWESAVRLGRSARVPGPRVDASRPGSYVVSSRATDTAASFQPLAAAGTYKGYADNALERIPRHRQDRCHLNA